MKLTTPVTLEPQPVTLADGTVHTFTPVTVDELNITIVDRVSEHKAVVKFENIPGSLVLWQGSEYKLMGDYTQEQVELRILQKLNKPNPKTVLEELFQKHAAHNARKANL